MSNKPGTGELRCLNVPGDICGAVDAVAERHGMTRPQWVMHLVMRELKLELSTARRLVNLMNAPHATKLVDAIPDANGELSDGRGS